MIQEAKLLLAKLTTRNANVFSALSAPCAVDASPPETEGLVAKEVWLVPQRSFDEEEGSSDD